MIPRASVMPKRLDTSYLPPVLLGAAILLGLVARLVRLGEVPPLLWYDEAWFVNRARDVLATGVYPLYFANAGAGVHPLHVYLTAAMARVAGISPLTGRLVTALAGTATIPLVYLAGRDLLATILGERRKNLFAAMAALLQAGLFWNVALSRLGTEIIHVQLLAIPAFHLFALGLQRMQRRWFALSGLLIGIAQYSSPNARFIPITVILITTGVVLLRPARRGVALRGLVLAGLVALLVFAPLGLHFAQHPDDFFGRARTVTAETFGAANVPLALLRNAANTLIGISIRGDAMIRHNLPGRPNLNPILSVFFWLGVVVLARRIRRDTGALVLLAWSGGMTLTTLLSDGAPIFTRSLGAAPAMLFIVIVGAWRAHGWLAVAGGRRTAIALLASALTVATAWDAYDYFVRFAQHPAAFDGFTAGEYRAAETARALAEHDAVYLSPWNAATDKPNHELLLHSTDVRGFNTADCQMYFPDRTNHYLVDAIEDYHGINRLQGRFPTGRVTQIIAHEPDPYPLTRIFTVPVGAPPNISIPVGMSFAEDHIALVGAEVWSTTTAPGELLYVTLAWQALQPVSQELVVLVHVAESATAVPAAGHDSAPCNGTIPTTAMRPGEIVFDGHVVPLPADMPPGDYSIFVGLYTWPEQVRVPPDAGGTPDGRRELIPIVISE
ncbi:MAG: ArnT family glycosyltransferase [Anaerolineales bacterium]